jgi:hypothetical protein
MPFGPPEPPSPAQIEQMKAYQKASIAQQISDRRDMLRWAMIFCDCAPWYQGRGSSPPQVDCQVHGTMLISPDGRVM